MDRVDFDSAILRKNKKRERDQKSDRKIYNLEYWKLHPISLFIGRSRAGNTVYSAGELKMEGRIHRSLSSLSFSLFPRKEFVASRLIYARFFPFSEGSFRCWDASNPIFLARISRPSPLLDFRRMHLEGLSSIPVASTVTNETSYNRQRNLGRVLSPLPRGLPPPLNRLIDIHTINQPKPFFPDPFRRWERVFSRPIPFKPSLTILSPLLVFVSNSNSMIDGRNELTTD